MLPSRAGEIALSVSVSPFPASRQVLLHPPPPPPAPWRRRRTSFRPLPAGAAGVIQQGRGGYPCRGSHAGGSQLPESARSLRPVLAHKCEIGQHLTPSSPWCFCLYPLPRFSVQSRPLARQRHVQCLRDAHSAVDFRTKNLLPGVATPLNCRFPPPTRSTVLAHGEGWRRAFL